MDADEDKQSSNRLKQLGIESLFAKIFHSLLPRPSNALHLLVFKASIDS